MNTHVKLCALALISLLSVSAAQAQPCKALESAPAGTDAKVAPPAPKNSIQGCIVYPRDPSRSLATRADFRDVQQHVAAVGQRHEPDGYTDR